MEMDKNREQEQAQTSRRGAVVRLVGALCIIMLALLALGLLRGVGGPTPAHAQRALSSTRSVVDGSCTCATATPKATDTAVPPTATKTSTPVPPTSTNTPVPPTATKTSTPVPPTSTNTPVPPTATMTNTPVPPTNTNTPVPPTSTNTPVPPTATKTSTPVPPTSTNTPVPPTSTSTPVPTASTCNCTPPPPVVCTVTTGSGQTNNVTFISISQVFVNISLRSARQVNRIVYVRVTNASGTVVLSSVGGFRMTAVGRFHRIRLLNLVAVSQARVAAGGAFRLQFSTNRRFAGAVYTTAAFKVRSAVKTTAVHHGHKKGGHGHTQSRHGNG
jgi:hypothetical protein